MRKIYQILEERLSKLSWIEWLEVIFHPIILPSTTIPAWAMSLWASRVLLWGQWSRYHGFHANNAINNLYCRTQWININRYGRLANSPILGLGNFRLSNWWYLSLPASYFYANAGAVTTLLGTLILVFSHLVWLQAGNWLWVVIVTILLFFSSTAYLMAFSRQNYQILAWMFVPMSLFGLLNDQLIVSASAFLAAAILGVTAFVVSSFLVVLYSIYSANFQLLWVLLPALGAASIKLLPLLLNENRRNSLLQLAKLIGLVHVAVRYKRTSMVMRLFNIYFLLLYGVALGLIWYGKGDMPILLLGAFGLFFLNQRFMRFADDQSMIISFVMVAAVEVLLFPFQWIALLGLVVAANPILKPFQAGRYALPKSFAPFDVEPLLCQLRNFLNVHSGTRVLIAFDDPREEYEKIFDGYRILLEASLVVAAEKEVHLFPDWYAVMETNCHDAPPIWGRTVNDVECNLAYWQTEYVVVYQDAGTVLSPDWLVAFKVVSEFDWQVLLGEDMTMGLVQMQKNLPKWWLLRKVTD